MDEQTAIETCERFRENAAWNQEITDGDWDALDHLLTRLKAYEALEAAAGIVKVYIAGREVTMFHHEDKWHFGWAENRSEEYAALLEAFAAIRQEKGDEKNSK